MQSTAGHGFYYDNFLLVPVERLMPDCPGGTESTTISYRDLQLPLKPTYNDYD